MNRTSLEGVNSTRRPHQGAAVWLLYLGMCAGLLPPAFGAEPGTQPATPARIEPVKGETPRQALERGAKVYDQLDVKRAMELFRYDEKDPKERELTASLCEYAVAATRVEQAVRRKLGDEAAVEVVHSIGESTEKDLAEADVKVEGDTATVKLPNAAEAVKMVRVEGVWKVSMKDLAAGMKDADVKETVEKYRRSAAGFERVAGKVEAGKLKSAREVSEAMDRVLNPPPPQPGGPV